jgi:hypothetical protein
MGSQRFMFADSPNDQIGLSIESGMLGTHATSDLSARHWHGSQPLGKGRAD